MVASHALTPAEARRLAADIFLLGFPLLLMDAVRRVHPVAADRFLEVPSAVGLTPGLAAEDPHTLQTTAFLDLSNGPVVLHAPDMRLRFFALTLLDAVGEPFAALGSRSGDGAGRDIALVGPRWRGELSGDLRAVRAPSDPVWLISRITTNPPADLAKLRGMAALQRLTPLNDRLGSEKSPPALALAPIELPAVRQLADRSPEALYHRLAQLVERASREVREQIGPALGERLDRLPPRTGSGLAPELEAAMRRGFADSLATVLTSARGRAETAGWRTHGESCRAPAATPLARAVRALTCLGAPLREDILTLSCEADESGRPLTGTERYRIRFQPGRHPPAEVSWRLSAEPVSARLEGRAAGAMIGDHSDLRQEPDGALEIAVQAERPRGRINWLAAPGQAFALTMRLYWPRPAALDGSWRMPPVERLGSRAAPRRQGADKPARPAAPDEARQPTS